MHYVRLSTVLVVLTVVLAGCSGGGTTTGAPTPTDGATTDADTTDATSNDAGDASSSGLSVSEADDRLREAGSFTTTWSYSVTDADGTTTAVNDTYRVDLDDNRSIELFTTDGESAQSEFEIFIADGTSYARYGSGESVFYQASDQPQNVFDSATGRASGFYGYLEEDATFVGTETFDGVTVSRYEYTDVDAWQTYNQGVTSTTFDTDEEVTITDFSITVLVDENDVGRLTTWTLVGETEGGDTVSVEWRYSLTDVGSTTVEEPSWLDEAQAQT